LNVTVYQGEREERETDDDREVDVHEQKERLMRGF
jgi:hypothetical protein